MTGYQKNKNFRYMFGCSVTTRYSEESYGQGPDD